MRTGCDQIAEAQLSFDPVHCHAWLDLLSTEPGAGQELCGLHAANLRVPQGWDSQDRRAAGTVASEAPAETPAPTLSEGSSELDVEQPVELVHESDPLPSFTEQLEAEPEPAASTVAKKPRREHAKKRPKPSLLSRALRSTGPQRSALSEELGAPSSTETSSTDPKE